MRRVSAALLALVAAAVLAGGGQAATKPNPTRGVVLVETNLAYQDAAAAGTGIVLTPSGEVLTNNHVIRGATTITVTVPATKRRYKARVLGYDVVDDVALLKLVGARKLATAPRGNSATLRVGQTATAVGNANGGGRLVTSTGTITGLRRTITVDDEEGGTARLTGLIRTSAHLVPGDSGGPLLDAAGRVIGVDAVGSSSTLGSTGGFAIPINRAIALVKLIRAGTSTAKVHVGGTAFLGVSLTETSAGLVVGTVVDGGAAATAGISQGDVLTAIDGRALGSVVVLRTVLFAHHPGDTVTIRYLDPLGNEGSADVVLADGPPQ